MKESPVLKKVSDTLGVYEFHKVVIWWERLNSGKVRSMYSGRWVGLCDKGTSDFVAVIRNREGGLSLLFIECKRGDGQGHLSEYQEKFRDKYKALKDVYYMEVIDSYQVKSLLERIGIDRTSEIVMP